MTKKLPNPVTFSKSKYGATLRKRHASVLRKLQRKRKCPKCGSKKITRKVAGIWNCLKCNYKVADLSYDTSTIE
mgnify:CR=1 FL=1